MTELKPEIITIRERIEKEPAEAWLELGWDQRQKSRFRSRLKDGREGAVILSREGGLRHGDCLRSDSGLIIEVTAATEELREAHCQDALLFSRAAYHMGNRHVPLEIRSDRMLFKPDHVLEAMLTRLGMEVSPCHSTFDPESGAYGEHTHGHTHEEGASHDHGAHSSQGARIHLMHDTHESDDPA